MRTTQKGRKVAVGRCYPNLRWMLQSFDRVHHNPKTIPQVGWKFTMSQRATLKHGVVLLPKGTYMEDGCWIERNGHALGSQHCVLEWIGFWATNEVRRA